MTSAQFKPQRERSGGRKPSRSLVALADSITAPIAERYSSGSLNQHDQSLVYREHCASLSASRPKRKKRDLTAKPWTPPVSNRESERHAQLARIAARKAAKRARAES